MRLVRIFARRLGFALGLGALVLLLPVVVILAVGLLFVLSGYQGG